MNFIDSMEMVQQMFLPFTGDGALAAVTLSERRETYLLFAVRFSCDARIYILLSLNILKYIFRRIKFRDMCCPLSGPQRA